MGIQVVREAIRRFNGGEYKWHVEDAVTCDDGSYAALKPTTYEIDTSGSVWADPLLSSSASGFRSSRAGGIRASVPAMAHPIIRRNV